MHTLSFQSSFSKFIYNTHYKGGEQSYKTSCKSTCDTDHKVSTINDLGLMKQWCSISHTTDTIFVRQIAKSLLIPQEQNKEYLFNSWEKNVISYKIN